MGHLHLREAKMSHQVLARKWRPRNFQEVVGQPHVVKALVNGLDNDRLHHAFLFTGTRGVGKTTLARILAKSLNCEQGVTSNPCGVCEICQSVDQGRFVDLIEVDAASRTKVEDTREILDNIQYAPTRGRYKVYLIDEVHMLSNSSFNALLKTLEEPPSHVKFLLATTDPQKLPVTVLSRCLRFHLKKIPISEIQQQLSKILEAESIPFESEALRLIAAAGEGSMRDALSLLDQAIAFSGNHVDKVLIADMLGIIDKQHILNFLEVFIQNDLKNLIMKIKDLSDLGIDFAVLLEDLITAFHQLALLQLDKSLLNEDLLTDEERWQVLAERISPENLQLYYQIALHARRDLFLNPNMRLGFEMAILRMLCFTPNQPALSTSQAQRKTPLLSTSPSIDNEKISINTNVNGLLTSQKKEETLSRPSEQVTNFSKTLDVSEQDNNANVVDNSQKSIKDRALAEAKAAISKVSHNIKNPNLAVKLNNDTNLANFETKNKQDISESSLDTSKVVDNLPWQNESKSDITTENAESKSIDLVPEKLASSNVDHKTSPVLDELLIVQSGENDYPDAFLAYEEMMADNSDLTSVSQPDPLPSTVEEFSTNKFDVSEIREVKETRQTPISSEVSEHQSVKLPRLTKENWLEIVDYLSVSGVSKALIDHIVLDKVEANILSFSLEKRFAPLFTEVAETQFISALSEIQQHAVSIQVNYIDDQIEFTRAKQKDHDLAMKLQDAKESLQTDVNIRHMQDLFQADLLLESVGLSKPVRN